MFYREVLVVMLNSGYQWRIMARFLLQKLELVHGSLSNEKGCEDVFKRWGRCASTSENNVVSNDRLNFSQRCASAVAYPNVQQVQASLPTDIWAKHATISARTLAAGSGASFRNDKTLAKRNFEVDGIRWTSGDRLPHLAKNTSTCAPANHSAQVGLEFLFMSCLDDDGTPSPHLVEGIRQSWMTGLAPGGFDYSDKGVGDRPPVVIHDEKSMTQYIVLLNMVGRVLLVWGLTAVDDHGARAFVWNRSQKTPSFLFLQNPPHGNYKTLPCSVVMTTTLGWPYRATSPPISALEAAALTKFDTVTGDCLARMQDALSLDNKAGMSKSVRAISIVNALYKVWGWSAGEAAALMHALQPKRKSAGPDAGDVKKKRSNASASDGTGAGTSRGSGCGRGRGRGRTQRNQPVVVDVSSDNDEGDVLLDVGAAPIADAMVVEPALLSDVIGVEQAPLVDSVCDVPDHGDLKKPLNHR